jgi:hypothetical protein
MKPPAFHRFVGLAAPLLLGACGGARGDFASDGERDGVRPGSGRPAPSETREAAPLVDADTLITLSRSECFGVCPVYSLSVTGEGAVSYLGTSYVKVRGVASSQVSVSQVQELVNEMWDAGYLAMVEPSPCGSSITDAPSVITSLRLGEQTHRVVHYHGNPCSPATLTTIEDRIDEVAGSERWLRCDTASGYCPSTP